MKLKDKQSLFTKTIPALESELAKAKLKLVESKLKLKTNKLKDTSQLKKLKYKISILRTFIHQKKLSESKPNKK